MSQKVVDGTRYSWRCWFSLFFPHSRSWFSCEACRRRRIL